MWGLVSFKNLLVVSARFCEIYFIQQVLLFSFKCNISYVSHQQKEWKLSLQAPSQVLLKWKKIVCELFIGKGTEV